MGNGTSDRDRQVRMPPVSQGLQGTLVAYHHAHTLIWMGHPDSRWFPNQRAKESFCDSALLSSPKSTYRKYTLSVLFL